MSQSANPDQADLLEAAEPQDAEPSDLARAEAGDAPPEALAQDAPAAEGEEAGEEAAAKAAPKVKVRPVKPLAERFARLLLTPVEAVPADRLPIKAEPIDLPDSAIEDIHLLLTGTFFAQAGIDLASRAPAEIPRFLAEARRVRDELQDRDAAVVELNGLLGNQFLQCVVLREIVLVMQDLRSADQELQRESASAFTYLPPEYALIPDAARQRLLLARIGEQGNRYWQIALGLANECKAPRDAVWLPGMSFLAADPQSRHVVERGLDGEVHWQYNSAFTADHALRAPVKVTRHANLEGEPRYLIADQGTHRVIEVDDEQRITWQYGVMGQSRDLEGYLNGPLDIQFTPQRSYLIADSGNHRILEIQNRKIIHSLGETDGLDRPVYAERLDNGHTLIVDELRHTIFEFDTRFKRVRECAFFRPGMDERLKTGKGLKVLRRRNQNLLLSDGEKLLEIDYLAQKLLWFTQLRTLQPLLSRPLELGGPDSAAIETKAYDTFDSGPPPAEIVTLRQMLMSVPLFESEKMPFFYEELEKMLKFRDYHPDTLIVEQGKPLKSMFFIQSGIVEILAEKEGEPVIEMKPGDSFGMMGIVFVEPRQSNIRAKTHCGLFELEKKPFDRLIENYPEIAAKITRLASERLAVSRIKQGQTEEKTKARFQEVLAMQKARFASAHSKVSEAKTAAPGEAATAAPTIKPTVQRAGFRPRRADYNEAEQHLIHEALAKGEQCLEVHIFLHITSMMKGARAFLLILVLERLGHILRSIPSLEDIKGEKTVGAEVVITLATTHSVDQVIEDASSVAEVDKVEVIPLGAEAGTKA